ncbi:hypothetical protein [Streptomyces sp. NPDC059788]|uniref:hypothetical protein n=1 Tax=Streptomyces sp. NPDC059788 TaxID=3346948 RepID=UPI003669B658
MRDRSPSAARFDDIREPESAYDVVTAADGLNSAARTTLFGPRCRARCVGASSWRGAVGGGTGAVTETWGVARAKRWWATWS